MRLYLSSYQNGNKTDEILTLLRDKHRTAVIVNAVDFKSDDERASNLAEEFERLRAIGLEPEEIDLRDYFNDQKRLKYVFSTYDFIWMRGGNVFVLMRALRQSGADIIIKEMLQNDSIAYGGYSAGIDVLQPHLRGVELVDDPSIIPSDYNKEIIWDCLGLVSFCIAEHYKSDHLESKDIDKLISYYIDHHIPFIALRDGEAIVVDGNNRNVVG